MSPDRAGVITHIDAFCAVEPRPDLSIPKLMERLGDSSELGLDLARRGSAVLPQLRRILHREPPKTLSRFSAELMEDRLIALECCSNIRRGGVDLLVETATSDLPGPLRREALRVLGLKGRDVRSRAPVLHPLLDAPDIATAVTAGEALCSIGPSVTLSTKLLWRGLFAAPFRVRLFCARELGKRRLVGEESDRVRRVIGSALFPDDDPDFSRASLAKRYDLWLCRSFAIDAARRWI